MKATFSVTINIRLWMCLPKRNVCHPSLFSTFSMHSYMMQSQRKTHQLTYLFWQLFGIVCVPSLMGSDGYRKKYILMYVAGCYYLYLKLRIKMFTRLLVLSTKWKNNATISRTMMHIS